MNPAFAMEPLTLRFPPVFERAFRRDNFRRSLRSVRLVLGIGTVLYGLFFIPFDYWLLPVETFRTVTAIRVATAFLLLGLFAFTFSARFEHWRGRPARAGVGGLLGLAPAT